ncbi:alkaline phosphatase D family protein [Thermaurantiacus sp.]
MFDPLRIDRRTLVAGAGAALLLPRRLAAAPLIGFTHGVASGEPGARSMLFWTRFVGAFEKPQELELEVATNPRMTRPVARARALADPANDWCAKVTVANLAPATTYYYRFRGPGNARSIIGRTRTLPEGDAKLFRIGLFSCSNLPFGWFNAYGQAVAADDIDLFVHVGDYIYEYARGTYPDARAAVPGRVIEPAGETVTLSDYRARYASYRADPDLQAIHAQVPAVTTWDDHEIANDGWTGGAENHQGASEGPWAARLAAARKAYREWMPVSDQAYERYEIGRLATLHRLDTRIEGRDQPLSVAGALRGATDMRAALLKFRDEQWLAGNRQLLGAQQEAWLFAGMEAAARRGTRWQLLAQQVIMGNVKAPADAAALLPPDPDGRVKALVEAGAAAARVGLPLNMDAWDGYPAARARLLAAAQKSAVNLIVLAGDSHNAWAFDLENDGRPAGVEFATQSVSSPGFESYLSAVAPADLAKALISANPLLKWCETSQRGYTHVTLTPREAVAEWRFTAPVSSRAPKLVLRSRARVLAGSNRLQLG